MPTSTCETCGQCTSRSTPTWRRDSTPTQRSRSSLPPHSNNGRNTIPEQSFGRSNSATSIPLHQQVINASHLPSQWPADYSHPTQYATTPINPLYHATNGVQNPPRRPSSPTAGSLRRSSTTTTSTCASPREALFVTALPGTMSTGDARNTTTLSEPSSQRRRTLAHRCKSAVKEMFTHRPVDESQFERIKSRHWAEDEL